MLMDAVLRLNRDMARFVAGGTPGEKVPTDLDVVVAELGVLCVVHAEQLCFFAGAELQPGDKVYDFGDEGGHDEGVGRGGCDGGNLPAEDFVVAVYEAALCADVDAIQADYFAGCEKGVEEEAYYSAYAVLCEDVERVVDANEKLDY